MTTGLICSDWLDIRILTLPFSSDEWRNTTATKPKYKKHICMRQVFVFLEWSRIIEMKNNRITEMMTAIARMTSTKLTLTNNATATICQYLVDLYICIYDHCESLCIHNLLSSSHSKEIGKLSSSHSKEIGKSNCSKKVPFQNVSIRRNLEAKSSLFSSYSMCVRGDIIYESLLQKQKQK